MVSERTDLMEAAQAAAAAGEAARQIARRLDVPEGTLRRWLSGPSPEAGQSRLGRPPAVEALSAEALRHAAQIALRITPAGNIAHPNVTGALRWLARNRPALLPPPLATRLAGGGLPPGAIDTQVRQLIRKEIAERARGPKRAALRTTFTPRANTLVDRDGIERPKRAGDVFVSDDLTLDWPFYTEVGTALWDALDQRYALAEGRGERGLDRCAERYGVRMVRAQCLATMDEATLRFCGHSLWSQNTDAYGCYAILWLYQQLFADTGLPRVIRHEHGSWAKRPVVAPLRACDIDVVLSETAKGKLIEMGFGGIHKRMAAEMTTRGLAHLYLGKTRGEYERGNKIWMACREGRLDPRTVGVPSMSEMMQIVRRAMEDWNDTVSHGTILRGRTPQAVWDEHRAADAPLRALDEETIWRLKPGVTGCALRHGYAATKSKVFGADGAFYANTALFSALGHNYPVELRYDIADPARAAVFAGRKAEGRVTRERIAQFCPAWAEARGWTPGQMQAHAAPGEWLGMADFAIRQPGVVLAEWDRHRDGHDSRRGRLRYASAQYQAIHGKGRAPGAIRRETHDGRGNSLRIDLPAANRGTSPEETDAILAAAGRVESLPPSSRGAGVPTPPPASPEAPGAARVTRITCDTPTSRVAPLPAPSAEAAERLLSYLNDD
ncbi:MAG: hypothetical protein LBK99_15570 [Opitutaceae bacterium]|jgi:hypothetical protein|nr:hypothetical protein [Opitutaceae bacterium]